MTADIVSLNPSKPKASLAPRLEWGKALAALRRLLADKEDTTAVFEIMRALNGDTIKKGYDRLLTVPDGGRMAYEARELAPRLMDDAWLDSFAPGSVGAAYRDFIRSENLSRKVSPKSAAPRATTSRSSIPMHGSVVVTAMSMISGTFSAAIIATPWARPVWWRSPMPRPRASAGP